jgi:hypothetical protein
MATVYHRAYAPMVVAGALTFAATAVAVRSQSEIDRYFAATCMAATFLSHYLGATFVISAACWILAAEPARWRRWIGPAALVILVCSPFVPAAMSGGRAKANSPMGTSGVSHALHLALSLPAFAGGFLKPNLQALLYTSYGRPALITGCALAVAGFLYGAWRTAGAPRVGLATGVLLGLFVPIGFALQLTTIRDFQGVIASVPLVALVAVGLGAASHRWSRGLSAAALMALVIFYALTFWNQKRAPREGEVAAAAIKAEPQQWPIYVWNADVPDFSDVALQVGLTRMEADAWADGQDRRVRALRSCSASAVRDAAEAMRRASVRILTIGDGCQPEELSGRGVHCAPRELLPQGVALTTCDVEPGVARRIGAIPARLPPNVTRRADRAIPPGHEELFKSAVAPMRLGEADAHGIVLSGIGIAMDYVKYELQPPVGPPVTLIASPQFVEGGVVGTDIAISPAVQTLHPDARAAADALAASFRAHVTPSVWNDVYGLVTNGASGHTPIKPAPWLALSLIAALVLASQLFKGLRRSAWA